MRHTLKAVFDDRDKAQQALEELLASGYARADTDLVTIPGARSASADDARAPRWRAHPGTSSARLLSRFLGHANRLPVAAHSPAAAADSHVLTLSTDSDQEAERAASLLSGAMAAGHRPGLSPGDTAFQEGPKGMPSLDDAARTAYHFGRDMHENDRYRNRSWDESDADLKVLWQAHDPARPGWDTSAPAVRRGWDSTSPEIDDDSYYRSHWRTSHANSAVRGGASRGPATPASAAPRRHPGEATAWEAFTDALKHGWDRIRIGQHLDEADYRLHHARTYPGTNYDDLAPVYRYGHHVRRRTMFDGRSWDEVESELRAEWERGHREGKPATWDEMKPALHAGWDQEKT